MQLCTPYIKWTSNIFTGFKGPFHPEFKDFKDVFNGMWQPCSI